MEQAFCEFLFQKHILVSDGKQEEPHVFETLFALANLFGISITKGQELAQTKMICLAEKMLGESVPLPFYTGFPNSVRKLTTEQLLFDQLTHYAVTYGFGNFSNAGHSLLEQHFERLAFRENCEKKEFEILTEEEAVKRLSHYVEDLLASSRPLGEYQYALVRDYIRTYRYRVEKCASKNTAIRLMAELRSVYFSRFLVLSDVIKLVDEIQLRQYCSWNIKGLNFRNQDRKFVTEVINELFAYSHCDLSTCYEKKGIWCGLLHHIHYRPKCEKAKEFVEAMRGKGNGSVYSKFEKAMADGDVRAAVITLKEGKGSGALLRNLNYIVSRIEKPEDLNFLLESIGTKNNVILFQLLLNYRKNPVNPYGEGRNFCFVKHNVMQVHQETAEEMARRKSVISQGQSNAIAKFMEENLKKNLKGKLGKVYVEDSMKNIALPLQESASQGGFGVLAKGSRIVIPEGKKIRAFTFWEKVNDIDLSVIGMRKDGSQQEFSWRTMANNQSDAITFSGDETSGYRGGSEYFDIDLEEFQKLYPDVEYLVFCDNVFSGSNFDKCFCKAGFMMRDRLDSGEIYEPKTVQTSFLINCPSTFAYLFGIDLKSREMIWLNVARAGDAIVAGMTSLAFLRDYFAMTSVMNMHRFFEMMATELVTDPARADVVVTDSEALWQQANGQSVNDEKCEEPKAEAWQTESGKAVQEQDLQSRKEWIRSYDFEKLFRLMN